MQSLPGVLKDEIALSLMLSGRVVPTALSKGTPNQEWNDDGDMIDENET